MLVLYQKQHLGVAVIPPVEQENCDLVMTKFIGSVGSHADAIDNSKLLGSIRYWLLNACDTSKSLNEIRVDIYNKIQNDIFDFAKKCFNMGEGLFNANKLPHHLPRQEYKNETNRLHMVVRFS